MNKVLSIVVPAYNEETTITTFFDTVEKVVKLPAGYSIEYWFIDDGSKDKTADVVRRLNAQYPDRVHYVLFSRNFGKEAALYAGLHSAQGDYVAVMDADLQDPPKMLPEMLNGIENDGYDVVGTIRTTREGEPPIRSFFAELFYKLINRISSTPMPSGVRDYRLMTRQVVDAILSLAERNRFSKGLFSWVGFNTKYLEYKNIDRTAGSSSWSFGKLFAYSIEGIVSFSVVPLAIISVLGIAIALLSAIAIAFIILRKVLYGGSVDGWASLVSVILFMSGIQLTSLGIVGEYISKIYLEIKNRPIYIAKESK